MTTTEAPPGSGDGHSAPPPLAPPRVAEPMPATPTAQRPAEPPQPEAARAAYPESDVPFIDFDEEGARVIARTRIGGEMFDVPPMPAAAMAWYVELQNVSLDDARAFDLVRQFVIRCFPPATQEAVAAALDRSPVTLVGLMKKGGELMDASAGVPPAPPSSLSPGGAWTDGGTSMGNGSGPDTPG